MTGVVQPRGIVKEYVLWLAKLVTVLMIIFFVIPAFLAIVMFFSGAALDETALGGKNHVGVVEMKGAIESSKEVVQQLYKYAGDEKIKGIVLRIDSPGGAVAPSQDIYRAVTRLKAKKPIVASMGSLAASGGLYSAVGASKVYAEPGTITGSIGVIMQVPNVTHIAERLGFDMVTIKSGKLKDIGNYFRTMTDEERVLLEGQLAKVHGQFVADIATGRKLDPSKVLAFADGRALMGEEAKSVGLIDEYGDVYDAARSVFEILGEPLKDGEEPTLVYPKDPLEEFREILKTASRLPSLLFPSSQLRFEMR